MTTLAVYRPPFGFMPYVVVVRDGETIADVRRRMPLPREFDRDGFIAINGHRVPSAMWHMIRPKVRATNDITFHMPMQGGNNDGKSVFAIVASIALTVATGWIASGGLVTKGGWFAAKSVSALVLAGGVSLAGSLLVSALIPPPTLDNTNSGVSNLGSASAEGNVLDPNTPIPRVIGERKVYPPLAAEPLVYFSGPDEIAEVTYVLAGPHRMRDIRLGAMEITSATDIEYEVREGWPGDPLLSLVSRQSRTERLGGQLRGHVVSADDNITLEVTDGSTVNSLPQVQIVATRQDPDEHQVQILMQQGLHRAGSDSDFIRVPLRIAIRQIGGEWVNLPELHIQGATLSQMRLTLRVVWQNGTTPMVSEPPATEGWVEARVFSPGQTELPASSEWSADNYFVGSGDNYAANNNYATTGVLNVELDRYTATIKLDTSVFPKGRYEISLVRGAAFEAASYDPQLYTYAGSVWDFWGARDNPGQIAMSRAQLMDAVYLARSVSIWNEHPLPSRDLASIAIRVKNRSTDKVSVVAGGYVKDWDGSGWNTWVVTSNPAPHLRDIYVGSENLDPVPEEIVDDDSLVAWRQHCIDMSYTCNALMEDQSIDDASRVVASCGYGKPYMADVWGVTWDRDRSSEAPVQLFTGRNVNGFQYTKGLARPPEGFRVNFRDVTRDYEPHQVSVFMPGNSNDSGRMEQVTYEGFVHESDAVARARYDMMQAEYRSTFYSWYCSAESIMCKYGDLVAAQHNMLSPHASSARVTRFAVDEFGMVTSISLDNYIRSLDTIDMLSSADLLAEQNLLDLGLQTGIAIRRLGTVTTHPLAAGSGAFTAVFDPPIDPTDIEADTLVSVGPMTEIVRRLLVFEITPKSDLDAYITAVPEAPELWI